MKAWHLYRYAALVLVVLLAACGASSRERALRTTLAAVDASAAGFETWDGQHQKAIVDQAKSADEATASITAYRLKREQAVAAFEVAYHAIAAAALHGSAAIGPALKAAEEAYQVLEELKHGGTAEAATGDGP